MSEVYDIRQRVGCDVDWIAIDISDVSVDDVAGVDGVVYAYDDFGVCICCWDDKDD